MMRAHNEKEPRRSILPDYDYLRPPKKLLSEREKELITPTYLRPRSMAVALIVIGALLVAASVLRAEGQALGELGRILAVLSAIALIGGGVGIYVTRANRQDANSRAVSAWLVLQGRLLGEQILSLQLTSFERLAVLETIQRIMFFTPVELVWLSYWSAELLEKGRTLPTDVADRMTSYLWDAVDLFPDGDRPQTNRDESPP